MADDQSKEARDRRRQMDEERDEEVEKELERIDEEMDPKETKQADSATLPADGETDRKDEEHVETSGQSDSA